MLMQSPNYCDVSDYLVNSASGLPDEVDAAYVEEYLCTGRIPEERATIRSWLAVVPRGQIPMLFKAAVAEYRLAGGDHANPLAFLVHEVVHRYERGLEGSAKESYERYVYGEVR